MDDSLKAQLATQFAKLPRAVQNAITSADVEKEMRALSEKHKLHLDQWQRLENEVMMTLLGINPVQELGPNIQKEVGVSQQTANDLLEDIARIVFAPIRDELERELGAPQAREESLSYMEKMRREVLSQETESGKGAQPSNTSAAPSPVSTPSPATPPPPPPTEKIVRTPSSGAYVSGETSAVRANVVDDPYRETPQ